MPKQEKAIDSFSKGIVLNASERDIPLDAAAFSLNVDPNTKDGILSGIKNNKLLGAIDGNITEILKPFSIYSASKSIQADETFPYTEDNYPILKDINKFSEGSLVSSIGTKGYVENLNCVAGFTPYLEKLQAYLPHNGNSPTTITYAEIEPQANIGVGDVTIRLDGAGSTTQDVTGAIDIDLHSLFRIGDKIQLSSTGQYVFPELGGEIMEIESITPPTTTTAPNGALNVKRGAYGTTKLEYSTGTTYSVFINKVTIGGKGRQFSTNMGSATLSGARGDIGYNNLSGDPYLQISDTDRFKANATVEFKSSNNTLEGFNTGTSSSPVTPKGMSFYFYSDVENDNQGSLFTVKNVDHDNHIVYLNENISSDITINGNSYIEPSLIKNSTFHHQTGTDVGDDKNEVVNDWKYRTLGVSILLANATDYDNDSPGTVVRANENPYSDANIFSADKSADYYPYDSNAAIKISSALINLSAMTTNSISTDDVKITFSILANAIEIAYSYGDIIKIENEYMKVVSVTTGEITVERGFYNTDIVSHASGNFIYKVRRDGIFTEISKDVLKPDTNYSLSFWVKSETSQKATGQIEVTSTTPADYDTKSFSIISTPGTIKVYTFDDTAAGDATGDLNSDGSVVIQLNGLGTLDAIRDEIYTAINGTTGHNGEITADNSVAATVDLEQYYGGFAGNTSIVFDEDLTDINVTDFQYGISPVGMFSMNTRGGYFNEEGEFTSFLKTDIGKNNGVIGTSQVPTQSRQWNNFSVMEPVYGENSLEEFKIDDIKWIYLSYKFKTPPGNIDDDYVLSFINNGPMLAPLGVIGSDPCKFLLSGVSLDEETYIINTSKGSGLSVNSGFVENQGNRDLVMYDYKNSSLRFLLNFNSRKDNNETQSLIEKSHKAANQIVSVNNQATFAGNNKETHIGFGSKKADTNPQWVGYLNSKIFGRATNTLYMDEDRVPEYSSEGANNLEKVCLAGEYERIAADWSTDPVLTVTFADADTIFKEGDNIVVREYMDTNNDFEGSGVWYITGVSNTEFECKRNTNLDNNPSATPFDDGSDSGYISFRPYYYYAISRGDRYIARIYPEDRIESETTVDSDNYPMGKIEICRPLDFPVESICTSYAKDTSTLAGSAVDGGYIYALSSYADKIHRINVNVKYDEWEESSLEIANSISLNYKSFKWSNSHVNGNIDGTDIVFDSLAEESSPTITPAGVPTDIIETKGPLETFDYTQIDSTHVDVQPDKFDTRLWVQHSPTSEDGTFSQGDRFLFCSKSEYEIGESDGFFADRTPPTNVLYPTETLKGSDIARKLKGGPFVRTSAYSEDTENNPGIDGIGRFALYDYHKQDGQNRDALRRWGIYRDFDFNEGLPTDAYTSDMEAYAYSKPYVNFGENVGWNGDGGKSTSIKVIRYGLFPISDNDCDGILDGTGVIVPNTSNYDPDEKRYGDLHRKMSSHAVGLIGGSDVPWIRKAGMMYGDRNIGGGYFVTPPPLSATENAEKDKFHQYHQNQPEDMIVDKCVFVCTDMHYGDISSHDNKYDISSLATGTYTGDTGVAADYTEVTLSEDHSLQSGDMVWFEGSGGWGGWYRSYPIIAVTDSNKFIVAEDSTTTTGSGELWVGGFYFNKSGTGSKYNAGRYWEPYHYAFNKDDKSNGTIFSQHGAFSRKWYTERNNIMPMAQTYTDDSGVGQSLLHYSSFYLPAILNNVDRLSYSSGFMIRPFNMDDESFQNLTLGRGMSVDMPSFPDTIYHNGDAVKDTTDNKNQFASKLFISSPGEINLLSELDESRVFICDWNYLKTNESSFSDIVDPNDSFWTTTTLNGNGNPSWNYIDSGTIVSYNNTANNTNFITKNAATNPWIEVSGLTKFGFQSRNNFYAGLYVSIYDQDTHRIQTRKIVASYSNDEFALNYSFNVNPQAGDTVLFWTHSNVATAAVNLFKEDSIGSLKVNDLDPILGTPAYKSSGEASFSGSVAGRVTTDVNHNLTSGDEIIISGTENYNGTHIIDVNSPKTFTITTSTMVSETGVWSLVPNSNSSASNPTVTPLNSPAIKMTFGDLNLRRLREWTVTASVENSDIMEIAATGALATQQGETLTWNASDSDYDGTYIVDASAGQIDVENDLQTGTTPTGTLYSNQWGGIGASTASSSTLAKIRAGFTSWDKGDVLGNSNRYDASDDSRFISITETSISITRGSSIGANDYFLKNKNYKYKLSLIYDGYQEGPLSSGSWVYNETETANIVNISIAIKEYSKRLTHVCIYRKDSDDSFYRLVRQISTASGWAFQNGVYKYLFQDLGVLKASFEARTGISELNKDLGIKYGISTECSGFLFAGDCSHTAIENASNQIFRSKRGKFSIFDWSTDFVMLKTTPTAMANYLGKLFVFDDNNIYKINPETLQIEDTFEGIGCSGKDSIIVTEYGMYFANRYGAYFHDGMKPTKISVNIQSGGKTNMLTLSNASSSGTEEIGDLSWESTAGNETLSPPTVSFDPINNTVLFIVGYNDTDEGLQGFENRVNESKYIWAFTIDKGRWDLWELSRDLEVGTPFVSQEGDVCISVGNTIMSINRGSNKMLYKWLTKKLTMLSSTNKKVFNKIKIIGPKTSLLEGDEETKLIVSTDTGRINNSDIKYKSKGADSSEYKLSSKNKTGKWVQFKLEEMEEEVDSLAIIFRARSIK